MATATTKVDWRGIALEVWTVGEKAHVLVHFTRGLIGNVQLGRDGMSFVHWPYEVYPLEWTERDYEIARACSVVDRSGPITFDRAAPDFAVAVWAAIDGAAS